MVAVFFMMRRTTLSSGASFPMPSPEDINAMMKDFDFGTFVKELEKEMAAIEDEEAVKSGAPAPAASAANTANKGEATAVGRLGILPGSGTKKEEPATISQDPVELLRTPPVVTVTQGSRKLQLPHERAEKALIDYCHDLQNAIESINKKALTLTSEAFREYYTSTLDTNMVELDVALSIITSLPAYRIVVLTPPKEIKDMMQAFRNAIIDARTKLMKLDKELVVSEATEISKEADIISALERLANPVAVKPAQPTRDTDDDDDNYEYTAPVKTASPTTTTQKPAPVMPQEQAAPYVPAYQSLPTKFDPYQPVPSPLGSPNWSPS